MVSTMISHLIYLIMELKWVWMLKCSTDYSVLSD